MYMFYRYDGSVERHKFGEHNHDEAKETGPGRSSGGGNESRFKLADDTKAEILRLFEAGTTKPNLIQQNLRKKGLHVKDTQLYVFLNRHKRARSTLGRLNVKQLCNKT